MLETTHTKKQDIRFREQDRCNLPTRSKGKKSSNGIQDQSHVKEDLEMTFFSSAQIFLFVLCF